MMSLQKDNDMMADEAERDGADLAAPKTLRTMVGSRPTMTITTTLQTCRILWVRVDDLDLPQPSQVTETLTRATPLSQGPTGARATPLNLRGGFRVVTRSTTTKKRVKAAAFPEKRVKASESGRLSRNDTCHRLRGHHDGQGLSPCHLVGT